MDTTRKEDERPVPEHDRMRVAAFPSHLESNPYCDLLYSHVRELGVDVVDGGTPSFGYLVRNRAAVDVLHFHWLERYCHHWRGGMFSYLAVLRFIALMALARFLGYRLVWTMHNLAAHESNNLLVDKLAVRFMGRSAKTAVHCEYARELLEARVPAARIAVIEHGSYAGVYPCDATRDEARTALGFERNGIVFLFFGMIRRYKGLEKLCESFRGAANGNAVLLIAGKPYEKDEETMVAGLRRRYESENLRFIPEFIPNEQVARYFLASDYCVFPFEDVLTSGSVVLSLGFGRPIVAPRVGCLSELEEHNVGFFYEAGDRAGLESALGEALACDHWQALADNAREYAESLSWKRIARQYASLYSP